MQWSDELPLTEYALAAQAVFNPEVDDTTRRCVAPGMPRALTHNPHPIEFVNEGDVILLRLQEFDIVAEEFDDLARFDVDYDHVLGTHMVIGDPARLDCKD